MTPATVLPWHPQARRQEIRHHKRRRPGRPPTVRSIARLTIRLAQENPLWVTGVFNGELAKLGVTVAASTVHEILRAAGIDPGAGTGRPGGSSRMHKPPGSSPPISCTLTRSR